MLGAMPRSIWKGSIAFGLVSIPVELHTAVRDHRPKFRMLHARDKSPVRYERVCQREGKPVAWEDLVKGFEYEKGRFVVLTKEDLKTAALSKDRAIDILDFVKSDEIDDRYFETPYYLTPQKGSHHAYALLRDALEESGRVGIAKIIIREAQHLAAVEVIDKALVLTLLRYRRRAGRHVAAGVSGRRKSAQGRARHGEDADREPCRRMGPIEVLRRIPRQSHEADQGEDKGRKTEAPVGGAAAGRQGRRPHGAPPPEPGAEAETGGPRPTGETTRRRRAKGHGKKKTRHAA